MNGGGPATVLGSWDAAFTQRMSELQNSLSSAGGAQVAWARDPLLGVVRQTVSGWYVGGACTEDPLQPFVSHVVHYCRSSDLDTAGAALEGVK